MEVAAKAVEFLSLPFQTWYRAAVIRQSIRELGRCDDRLLRQLLSARIDDDGKGPGTVVCISDILPCAMAVPQHAFISCVSDALRNGWLYSNIKGGTTPIIEARASSYMWTALEARRFLEKWADGVAPVVQAAGGT